MISLADTQFDNISRIVGEGVHFAQKLLKQGNTCLKSVSGHRDAGDCDGARPIFSRPPKVNNCDVVAFDKSTWFPVADHSSPLSSAFVPAILGINTYRERESRPKFQKSVRIG